METLTAGDAAVTIDHDQGGRLSSLVVSGHELLAGPVPNDPDTGHPDSGHPDAGQPDPMSWGCFPMVPFAGRIRHGRFAFAGHDVTVPLGLPPHAIHGTAYRLAWTPNGPGQLTCDLGPDWPWAGTASQTVTLTEDALHLTLSVHSRDGAMPVSLGWHPWFRRHVGGSSLELDVPASAMWHRDPDGIPDGTLVAPPHGPWDDCFTGLDGPVRLRWPDVLEVEVSSDCPHVVVFDEPAHAACVEPQSAPPDAHNSGHDLREVRPGTPATVSTTWRWRPSPGPLV